MKQIAKYFGFLIFLVLAFAIGYLGGISGYLGGRERPQEAPLPTIQEIQERVGAIPDGKLGPETQEKWNEAVYNQYAAKWDYYYEEPK